MEMAKKPLIVLTGPTAAGKTELSLALAKEVDGEIISADSMQVYRYMDIGSAKIKEVERQGIPHHLIDVLNPDEEFNVVLFQQMAKKAMADIYTRNRIPILTGGTGFYIQAVLYDIDFTVSSSQDEYRKSLMTAAEEKGSGFLHEQLSKIDKEAAEKIHPHNTKRIIRALEFYQQTGLKISEHNEKESGKDSPYRFTYFVLNRERAKLYERIDNRVDQMLDAGLLNEVAALKKMGYTQDMVSMQGLGYKELLDYLTGNSTYEEAVYLIKRDTRHFAKRQLTWFRRERQVDWLDIDLFNSQAEILEYMKSIMKEKGIVY